MTSLDTNVVLRFLLDDVPGQTKKVEKVISQKTVYVTDVVVVEIIYVLEQVYKIDRKEITKLILAFLNFSNVVYNEYFLQNAIHFYANHPALSITDCYIAKESETYKNALITFDRKLSNQGGSHVELV